MSTEMLKREFYNYESGQWLIQDTEIVVESSVSLTVNGEIWFSFLCTPVALEALAVGFLFNEGIIESSLDVASVRLCPTGDNIDVWLHANVEKPKIWNRTSGCSGGATSVDFQNNNNANKIGENSNGFSITSELICDLVGNLTGSQHLYKRSGGIHTSALCDRKEIVLACEDIGRHNTLDKLAGRCLLDDTLFEQRILLTTGRVSSEMIQKASRMGIVIIISRTSPTSLSVQQAERGGITIIGYASTNRFRIYSHPNRVLSPQ